MTPRPGSRGLAYTAVLALVIGLALAGSQWLQWLERPEQHIALERVVAAAPAPTPTSDPAPRTPSPSPECESLDNPGGGLRWMPSSDAGPWPTDASVALPTLGVDAPVVRVGVGTDGEMVVPDSAQDVAWFHQGKFPGRTQNAVLAGHISWGGQPGVFARLGDLREGDPVVAQIDGERWEFWVTWTCAFDRDTPRAEQIMGRTSVPSVTLVTCGGTFDRRAGTHTDRIVVRAELASVTDTA